MSHFFSLNYETHKRTSLQVPVDSVSQCRRRPCKRCQRFTETPMKQIALTLPRRRRWPDIGNYFSESNNGLLWSERLVHDLVEAGIVLADSVVTPEIIVGPQSPASRYCVLNLPRDLDLDMASSGVDLAQVSVCPVCGSVLSGVVQADRYVPREGSWRGNDLFMLRYPKLHRAVFCTRRVLDLAREKRWRGLRFEPIDVERKLSLGWDGIDYLGKKWPPDSWYPKRPSEGRSPRAWLEMYNSVRDGNAWYEAWRALLDCADDALPLVLEQLRSADEDQRIRAARLLLAMDHGSAVDVPKDAVSQARAICPLELQPPTGANLRRQQCEARGSGD